MRNSLDLIEPSSKEWVETVINDFDAFLQDHADCERKASAMALSLVAKYPDKNDIIPQLIETSIEELDHFKQVYDLMRSRGISLAKEIEKDNYVIELLSLTHGGTPQTRFRDRLLVASVVECRGCERFRLISEAIQEEEMKKFYKILWVSEAKHGDIYVKMALKYFNESEVYNRLEEIISKEAEILKNLPLKPALH